MANVSIYDNVELIKGSGTSLRHGSPDPTSGYYTGVDRDRNSLRWLPAEDGPDGWVETQPDGFRLIYKISETGSGSGSGSGYESGSGSEHGPVMLSCCIPLSVSRVSWDIQGTTGDAACLSATVTTSTPPCTPITIMPTEGNTCYAGIDCLIEADDIDGFRCGAAGATTSVMSAAAFSTQIVGGETILTQVHISLCCIEPNDGDPPYVPHYRFACYLTVTNDTLGTAKIVQWCTELFDVASCSPFAVEIDDLSPIYDAFGASRLDQLKLRWSLFTGKRVLAVATSSDSHDLATVQSYMAGYDCEWIHVENDPDLREVKTFLPLFERIEGLPGYTFYAQGKGVTKPINQGVSIHHWTSTMYDILLDYWPLVEERLQTHPVVGAFKKSVIGAFRGSRSSWHYSGSFCWLNNAELWKRNWRAIERVWFGIETYPSMIYSREEAACLFFCRDKQFNLYSLPFWQRSVERELALWRSEKVRYRFATGSQMVGSNHSALSS